jgi:glycosyltransferase involved in cell wall biosynthesis
MRILLVHEYYQHPGGEDELFEATGELLRAHGHEVSTYVRRNEEIAGYSAWQKVTLGAKTTWAWDTRREFEALLGERRPELVQFFNTFPLISPAVYGACHAAGAQVVQSLDNPRMICPASTFSRNGRFCTDCVDRTPWPAALHGCYRSRAQSAATVAMVATHRLRGTWCDEVDAYVVATSFWIEKFIAHAGLPRKKMHLRRHFLMPEPRAFSDGADEFPTSAPKTRRHGAPYALFMGRLAPEKGVVTLLEAWRELEIPLKIRGAGPLEREVREFAATRPHVELLPRLSHEDKLALIRGARFLVWPSQGWYETFGLVAAEAFACGVPVIASRTGVAEEMVTENVTGRFFAADEANDLSAQARWASEHGAEMQAMGRGARADFEARFTPAAGYRALMSAYGAALGRAVEEQAVAAGARE